MLMKHQVQVEHLKSAILFAVINPKAADSLFISKP